MPADEHTSTAPKMIPSARGRFSYRMSFRTSLILVTLVVVMSTPACFIATSTYAKRVSPTSSVKSLSDFLVALCAQSFSSSLPAEAPFLTGNVKAMSKMMTGMAITPSGNVDKDFAAIMEPHHKGAIDMAILELRYGSNPILRRIAQEIIVDQQQEIMAMRLALGQPLPASAPAPDQVLQTGRKPQ